jgi:hypothetical protein
MNAELQSFLVRGTAWGSFAFYLAALCWWVRQPINSSRIRLVWSLAAGLFAIHVVCAFHLVHHWSHQAAWDATRLQGGYGDGVYLNYLVLIVWLGDAIWWWAAERSYVIRSRWITCILHGFLLFMWFNAAVIFAVGQTIWLGIIGFAILALVVLHQVWSRSKR